jgi:hypothetical protein
MGLAYSQTEMVVWVAIWLGGRSDLVAITRDGEAKRNRYSANSYLAVLDRTMERWNDAGNRV